MSINIQIKPQSEPLPIMPGTINNKRISAIVLIIVAVGVIISVASVDSTAFLKNTFLYVSAILFLVLGIFGYFITTFQSTDRTQIYSFLIVILVAVITTISAIYIIYGTGIINIFSSDLFSNLIILCIILLGLAIIYIVFLQKIISHPGWTSFLIQFIFYIPCLLADSFNYLLRDIITSPRSVYHLLAIETVLIIIHFYLYPKVISSTNDNGVVLITNPIMLNTKTRIDEPLYKSFINKKPDPISNTVTLTSPNRSTFSISMWIFLNIQSFSQLTYTKELNLFDYKSPEQTGCNCMSHPKVAYMNNKEGADQYIFYLGPTSDKKSSIKYSKSLPHQKWNNLVFNYRDGAVDIFINGKFETSVNIPTPIEYTNVDTINIGQNDYVGKDRSGIYGSICNIVYYRNILSQGQIINNYNLLNIKTPPVY
jgi:hypothetical protein